MVFGNYHIHRKTHATKPKHHGKIAQFFDIGIYTVAFLAPLMTLPQVLKIWVDHQTAGVSPQTWAMYTLASCFWIVYGFIHKEKVIFLGNLLFAFFNLSVFIGVLILH